MSAQYFQKLELNQDNTIGDFFWSYENIHMLLLNYKKYVHQF